MKLYPDPVNLSFSQLTSLLFVGHHVVVAIQPLPKRQPTFPRTPAALIASVTSAEILSQWQVSWREAGPASTGMPPCVSKSNWATICTIELYTPTNYRWCDETAFFKQETFFKVYSYTVLGPGCRNRVQLVPT